jgi:hypothetical protein
MFDNWFLIDVVAVMGDVFVLVCNFHVPLALKVGCPYSGVGCYQTDHYYVNYILKTTDPLSVE